MQTCNLWLRWVIGPGKWPILGTMLGLRTSISPRRAHLSDKGASAKELLHKQPCVKPERDAKLGLRFLQKTGSTWPSPWCLRLGTRLSPNYCTEISQHTDSAPVSLSSQLLRRGQFSGPFCFKGCGGVLSLGRAQAAHWAVPWEDLCVPSQGGLMTGR